MDESKETFEKLLFVNSWEVETQESHSDVT